MAPLRIRATPELVEQQQQHAQQQLQEPEDAASQASTASQPDEDDETLDDAPSDGCIAIDTIEAYTANIQNKKRIFAEEVLNVV